METRRCGAAGSSRLKCWTDPKYEKPGFRAELFLWRRTIVQSNKIDPRGVKRNCDGAVTEARRNREERAIGVIFRGRPVSSKCMSALSWGTDTPHFQTLHFLVVLKSPTPSYWWGWAF